MKVPRCLLATCVAMMAAVVIEVPAANAIDTSHRCEATKLKVTGRYGSCLLKAASMGVMRARPPDFRRCGAQFVDKWRKAEIKAGPGVCPCEGVEASMNSRGTMDMVTSEIMALLASGTIAECGTNIVDCGNGEVEVGEQCDFENLDGETCATQGLFGNGLACTPFTCLFDTSGCSETRFEDTGLGTVIDHQTGLEWQKTDDAGGLTDKDNQYTWTDTDHGDAADPDGTAFTEFLYVLNGGTANESDSLPVTTGCFAGRCDWRLPLIEELKGILLDLSGCEMASTPCIDQSVFGPLDNVFGCWSSTTSTGDPSSALAVNFGDRGFVFSVHKGLGFHVRAVAGG